VINQKKMMNSSTTPHGHDDDDFGPNPFLTYNNNNNNVNTNNDIFQMNTSTPFNTPANTNNNNNAMMNPNNVMMMHPPLNQPDPRSGMTGTLEVDWSPTSTRMPPTSPVLHGTMDTYNASVPPNAATSNTGGWLSSVWLWPACGRWETWQAYFNVDTTDVVTRLRASVLHCADPDHFRTVIVGNEATPLAPTTLAATTPTEEGGSLKGPDLYAPFWISATLVFSLAVTSNIVAYWHHRSRQHKSGGGDDMEAFDYDINLLVHATGIVFTFVYGVSTVFYFTTSCLGMNAIAWPMWICCYGYAQVPYVLATCVVWIFPWGSALWAWLVLALATTASALLIVRNLSTPLLAYETGAAANAAAPHHQSLVAPILLALLVAHFIYFCVLKIVFY
jgi:hypothetical protein